MTPPPTHLPAVGRALAALCMAYALMACGSKPSAPQGSQPQPYDIVALSLQPAVIYRDFPAVMQGEQDIEIRTKVQGYIEKVYIDEGAEVKKGQLLFLIDAPQYTQDVRTASASIKSAKAEVETARLQVEKVEQLVKKSIVSPYELELAKNAFEVRKALLQQAEAALSNANSNLSYTRISSPVDGVAGGLRYRIGSLVNSNDTHPLTIISSIKNVYAYFSMNEKQLLDFSRIMPGHTLNEKLQRSPPVMLLLSDGSLYAQKGRMEAVMGLFNTQTGSVSFRVTFPNPGRLIRSGASGTVRIPQSLDSVVLIPQRSTYELQDRRFVYMVGRGDTVRSVAIRIMEQPVGQRYIVTEGLKAGDRIVYDAVGSLSNGAVIKPTLLADEEINRELKPASDAASQSLL